MYIIKMSLKQVQPFRRNVITKTVIKDRRIYMVVLSSLDKSQSVPQAKTYMYLQYFDLSCFLHHFSKLLASYHMCVTESDKETGCIVCRPAVIRNKKRIHRVFLTPPFQAKVLYLDCVYISGLVAGFEIAISGSQERIITTKRRIITIQCKLL